eukprot:Hpha_TRINITY_DN10132_c0_g2::TRINITY_DN10132_c0_g2_i1::g.131517::m.131517
MSGVWLGLPAPDYEAAEGEEDAFFCKMGGRPVWLHDLPVEEEVACGECGGRLRLVAQLSCPLQEWDRVLYALACGRTACQMKPGSWRLLRAQRPNPDAQKWDQAPAPKPAAAAPAEAAFAVEDDWGSDESDDDGGAAGFGAAAPAPAPAPA